MPLQLVTPPNDLTGLPEAPANGTYRVVTNGSGSFLQLWNPTQSKWHTVWITGAAGAEILNFGPGET